VPPQSSDDESSDWQQRAVEDVVDRLVHHLSEARRGLRGRLPSVSDASRRLRDRLSASLRR
jgi:hypothetical protein